MSDQTLEEQIRGVRLSGCTCAPICERADDDVCDHCEYMDGLADKVGALENGLAYWNGIKDDNVKLKASIEEMKGEMAHADDASRDTIEHEQNARADLAEAEATVAKLEAVLRSISEIPHSYGYVIGIARKALEDTDE